MKNRNQQFPQLMVVHARDVVMGYVIPVDSVQILNRYGPVMVPSQCARERGSDGESERKGITA